MATASPPPVRLALLTALALIAAGCGSSHAETAAKGHQGGTLTFARAADIQSLDPTVVFDNPSIWAHEQIYETLFTVTADGQGVRPWLASSYTVSADKRSWTFKLRPGVKFSNGHALTAADVKFSLDRARASKKGFGYIDAATASVEAPARDTVVVQTKYPWAPLLADLSLFVNGVVPKDLGGKTADEFFESPVGTGPFVARTWQRGRHLQLTRNRHYWQPGKPYVDSVDLTVVPDDDKRLAQLKAQEAQIVESPPASAVGGLRRSATANAATFPSTRIEVLLPNERFKPFADVHVRRAIAHAIDRGAIVKAVLFGQGRAANSTLPDRVPFYNPENPGVGYDLHQARQELAQSAYPSGFDVEFLTSSDRKYAQIARGVQQELAVLGIRVEIRTVDPTDLFALQQKFDYELSIDVWTMDIPDPDEYATYSLSPAGGAFSFYTDYDNPGMTALVKRAQTTLARTERQKLYDEIQRLADRELPQIPLYYSPLVYGVSRSVHDFAVYPLGNYHLENVVLEP